MMMRRSYANIFGAQIDFDRRGADAGIVGVRHRLPAVYVGIGVGS
jgi:hypothetical protein